ncbi:TPA_asm: LexA family transcriptional repressor, partial [Salmonella enterica]|nr:LexA family transcriptional repressor [Salmonella enterica subsp. enterica serovar Typhimurium]EDS5745030.1 LexA family transcriptional repressor [Salmonella enterica subsp. enterica]HAC8489532.1 LexA family transcriptional repressor [Salmonella enterica]HCM4572321.1 LexA family transcriptional repressor [Salmonella enterica subsp. enterica serovar Typhimurium var. monophasic 4,[5],12:i:-]EDA7336468.1 LexA family transcriptional repressor [Salmonella enterica subsp. enterica serovar Typhimur
MKTIHDIRRSNARKLRDGVGGNSSFATMIDREPTQTSRFMGDGATKNIGDSMARHIEKCFDLPVGWLDQEHQTTNITKKPDVSITNKQITLVPVISWVQAGAWKEVGY